VYTVLPKHSTYTSIPTSFPPPTLQLQSADTHTETYIENLSVFRGQLAFLFVSISYKKGYAYSLRTCISPAGPACAVGSCEGLVVGLLHQVGSTVQVSQRTLQYIVEKYTECSDLRIEPPMRFCHFFPFPLDRNNVRVFRYFGISQILKRH
jgi:hypothetical protein